MIDNGVIGLILVMGVMIGGIVLAARLQSRSYRSYLERHTAETQKITENQKTLLAQQDVMIARQTDLVAAVTRVAVALEKRAP